MKYVVLKKPPLFRRFIAFLLDLMIVDIILFPFDWYFGDFIPKESTSDALRIIVEQYFSEIFIGLGLYFVVMIAYFSIFEYYLGKTPGKALWKMKVIQISGEKKYINFVSRSLQLFFIMPLWAIDLAFVFSKKRDRLLEKVSKTTVIIG